MIRKYCINLNYKSIKKDFENIKSIKNQLYSHSFYGAIYKNNSIKKPQTNEAFFIKLNLINYFNDTEAVSRLLKAFVTRLKSNPIALSACHK